ncbi:MAG: potassium transporter TrkA [Bacteroidetes bacterium]|nr:potassium transporter TrkA [Bacteroidota bacterium]MBT5528255.1 potassium transporter TrkA [Cytophagia bacterium]MBT3422734.1 potassium transporter TrkA [Bacteroidota bacterium]MBT4337098.1 potassium transporter TrkA [Bacteroidota bacterium]MBT4729390.1 potassium transporter TrkA [Bacteroidota bacterium]
MIYVLGFVWVLFASDYFAKFFQKIRLPLITGFLVTGIISGPHVLNLIEEDAINKLGFINDIALAFIAFAAGAELYLKELRSRFKSIVWNTIGQLFVTFFAASTAIYFLAEFIPFMQNMTTGYKIAVAILGATIFIARSPSSAIAVISEMRAKGPFTQTAMGVTVVIDVLVIVLFTICFSIAVQIVSGVDFNLSSIVILLLELLLALCLGYVLGKLISGILSLSLSLILRTVIILVTGYGTFIFTHLIRDISPTYLQFELHIEPLLICIVASFLVTNYSKYRHEFQKILHDSGPMIYVAFFTLVGAMLSLDILAKVWIIALVLFAVRLITLIIGAYIGGIMAGDPPIYKRIGWMPYVTQAGIGLGLATEIAGEFNGWGAEFATIIMAVIVLNQFVGPPLFKWVISYIGEAHIRAETPVFDGERDVIIFGLDDQSLALARQLKSHNWGVKIASLRKSDDVNNISDVYVEFINELNLNAIKTLETDKAEAIVLMLSDEENFKICELVYENIGTKEIVVKLNDRSFFNQFHEMGALIVEPATAMVGLLDHFVRAPLATSMILGMDEKHDTEDIEILDKDYHGISLRDLKLPVDVLILSVNHNGHIVVTHGYTRLRLGDIITVVGSPESIEELRLKFEV